MRRSNFVCVEHRIAHRRLDFWGVTHERDVAQVGSIHCPVDGQPMASIGYRWRIPKKSDDKGWAELRAMIQRARRRNHREFYLKEIGQNGWQVQNAERLLKRWGGS